MTGEMNEVDKGEYADWFKLAKEIREKTHTKAEVKPFDTYMGPYVYVPEYGLKFWMDEYGLWGERHSWGAENQYTEIGTAKDVVRHIKDLKEKKLVKV
jgi:hypothetical protein